MYVVLGADPVLSQWLMNDKMHPLLPNIALCCSIIWFIYHYWASKWNNVKWSKYFWKSIWKFIVCWFIYLFIFSLSHLLISHIACFKGWWMCRCVWSCLYPFCSWWMTYDSSINECTAQIKYLYYWAQKYLWSLCSIPITMLFCLCLSHMFHCQQNNAYPWYTCMKSWNLTSMVMNWFSFSTWYLIHMLPLWHSLWFMYISTVFIVRCNRDNDGLTSGFCLIPK